MHIGGFEKGLLIGKLMNHDTGHFICTFCENLDENKRTVSDHRSKDTGQFLIKNKIVGLLISTWYMLIKTSTYFKNYSWK